MLYISKLHFLFPFLKSYQIFCLILRSSAPFIKKLEVFNGGRGHVMPSPSFQFEGQILSTFRNNCQSNSIYCPYWNAVSVICKVSRWEEVHWLNCDKISWYNATFEGVTALLMPIPALCILTPCRLVDGTNFYEDIPGFMYRVIQEVRLSWSWK